MSGKNRGIFMKKFNLFEEIIVVKKENLLNALSSDKSFGIKIDGEISFKPYEANDILIFEHENPKNEMISIEDTFGKNYQVLLDGERVLIKAFSNWQDIINMNSPRCTYDDTTSDGVDEFSDKDLEDIGWHASEFDIKYRDLVEVLEDECNGTLICIEQENPYQFSGLGFIDDLKNAKDVLYKYCQKEVKRLINEHEDYRLDKLTDDEEEAAEFFKALN